MSYAHPSSSGAPDWESSLPLGPEGHVIQPMVESALAHLDGTNPDMSIVLRQMMNIIQRQNQQLVRLQTEMNDQFSRIGTRLDLQQQQNQQHATSIAAGLDAQNTSANEGQQTGTKRPSSPGQSFSFPASKHAARAQRGATNTGPYFDAASQQQQQHQHFQADYGLPYGIGGQRVPDLDSANSTTFLDESAAEGAGNGSSGPATKSESTPSAAKDAARPRDRPPPELYTSDDTFMDRGIRTLPDLWKEYTVGWNGKPSIKSMNQLYGTRWHYQPKEALYWGIRRHVYELIEHLRDTKYNGNVDAAIKELEDRMETESLTSIHKLGQALRMEKGDIIRRPGKGPHGRDSGVGPDEKPKSAAAVKAAANANGTASAAATNARDSRDEMDVDQEEDEDESHIDTALRTGAAGTVPGETSSLGTSPLQA